MSELEFNGEIYNDDRLVVYYVGICTVQESEDLISSTIYHNETPDDYKWCVVALRNVARYRAARVDHFDTEREARLFAMQMEPLTPLISLGGRPPAPAPSYEDFVAWKEKHHLKEYDYKKMFPQEMLSNNQLNEMIYQKIVDSSKQILQTGVIFAQGMGVKQNLPEAVKWFRKAANLGNAEAQFNLGVMYANGQSVKQDYAEAEKWYRKAAALGNTAAQFNLGNMYAFGRGVKQDYSEVVQWYRKAAAQGDADAQCNLSVMYANGQGVKQDYAEGVKWLRKAAEQGHVNAQANLGRMYAFGQGVKQDYAEAKKWYRKAAEQGDAKAQKALYDL